MRGSLFSAGLALGLVFALGGCKKGEKAGDEGGGGEVSGEAGGEAGGTAGEPAGGHGSGSGGGSGGGASEMVNKMMHCPSAVEGAKTEVEQTGDAVVVTVTAADPAKAPEIQKRAKHLASLTAAGTPEVKHTGQGTGGGALGKCPVIIADATLSVEDQNDGAKVTMKPKDAAKLGQLAQAAKERAAAMPATGAAGGSAPDAE
jgi:hypothetical protein